MDLVLAVYDLTDGFPKEETYGITSQIRRAAVSIPSNIAEGRVRGTSKDFLQFLRIAFGSCGELETQIEIAKRLSYGKTTNYGKVESLLLEVEKMLKSMMAKLNPDFIKNYEARKLRS